MSLESDRHFLLRLAAPYLACRFQVFGGYVITPWAKGHAEGARGLEFALLGMGDYERSMRMEFDADGTYRAELMRRLHANRSM